MDIKAFYHRTGKGKGKGKEGKGKGKEGKCKGKSKGKREGKLLAQHKALKAKREHSQKRYSCGKTGRSWIYCRFPRAQRVQEK